VPRKQKGFSQVQMAKALSTDTSNYSRKERGEVRINDEEWEKLANTLDITLEEIKEQGYKIFY
jgi:ribosome-binding protein aMBF1 (putative translation factor)